MKIMIVFFDDLVGSWNGCLGVDVLDLLRCDVICILKENQMEKFQSIDSQFQKNILSELPLSDRTLKIQPIQQDINVPLPHRELSLDHNQNSLALLARSSIQNGMPIPRAMLSHSDDLDPHHEEEQNEDLYFNHKIKVEVSEEDKEWFVEQLGLNQLLYLRKYPNNTKNVLRNFGNAQNQYALYHQDAKVYVDERIAQPDKFYAWIRTMRLEKFDDFKAVWSEDKNKVFKKVYREICYKFYRENAIPYVLASRMKCTETKLSHLRYIFRFLQGLKNPEDFTYFKKLQK